jgi:hypothetical protein
MSAWPLISHIFISWDERNRLYGFLRKHIADGTQLVARDRIQRMRYLRAHRTQKPGSGHSVYSRRLQDFLWQGWRSNYGLQSAASAAGIRPVHARDLLRAAPTDRGCTDDKPSEPLKSCGSSATLTVCPDNDCWRDKPLSLLCVSIHNG